MYFDEAIHGTTAIGLILPRHLLVLRRGAPVAVATVMLPVGNPVNQHLPYLNVRYRHFLHRVHFQCRSMQHFLDGSRCRLENPERNHLIQTELQVLGLYHYI